MIHFYFYFKACIVMEEELTSVASIYISVSIFNEFLNLLKQNINTFQYFSSKFYNQQNAFAVFMLLKLIAFGQKCIAEHLSGAIKRTLCILKGFRIMTLK